jgi:hypothetical protein
MNEKVNEEHYYLVLGISSLKVPLQVFYLILVRLTLHDIFFLGHKMSMNII